MEIKRGYWWRRDGGLAYVCHLARQEKNPFVWCGVIFQRDGRPWYAETWSEAGQVGYPKRETDLVAFAGDECPTTWTRPEPQPQYVAWDWETFPKDRPVWVHRRPEEDWCLVATWGPVGVLVAPGYGVKWEDFFRDYTQHDGTPCGRRVE